MKVRQALVCEDDDVRADLWRGLGLGVWELGLWCIPPPPPAGEKKKTSSCVPHIGC